MRLAAKVILGIALTLALGTGLARWVETLAHRPSAFPGYTLVAPLLSTNTHLVDMEGRIVRTWTSEYTAGQTAYLLENGHLLRAGQVLPAERLLVGPAAGGRVQEFTWEGELVWDFKFHNAKQVPHHDIARLPNGHVLLLVWELKTAEETIAAGRRPEAVAGPWLADSVLEVRPTGPTTGEVVWEWHVWDHLIQDRDASRANYGEVAAHPELIDINVGESLATEVARTTPSPDTLKTLRSIGYVGSRSQRAAPEITPDWTHINAVAYNAELDQIMLTVRQFHEFWIIDHSTTPAEAAGHTGGRSGKGGDLLYRWGNPQAYRAGTKADQRLFAPHDAQWIPRDRPGAGHALVFNNGLGRPGGDYSSVDELVLPVDAHGHYVREPGMSYGPNEPIWRFTAPTKTEFFAGFMSGAQRLPNGNTLICNGVSGTIFEVTRNKEAVWTYTYAETGKSRSSGSAPPGRNPVFRAYRYGVDYPGLAGRDLRPGG
ncbi:MAG TPA: aryl-sulfate sulfotransferase [Isosphaeraceae bacterium]|nr:aryl-sulfate sulfotransferase [Isosphaeraceae bacterium]